MPIKVKCKCGRAFAAKDAMAGKVVRCPNCAQPLRIPKPQAAQQTSAPAAGSSRDAPLADLLDEVGLKASHDTYAGRRCPSCDAPLAQNAILCIECGLHLETGKFVQGVGVGPQKPKDAEAQAEGHEAAAELLLDKAADAIQQDALEERKMRSQGMPLWLLASLLAVIVTFMVVMLMLPRDVALIITGVLWMSLYGIVILVCGIWLRVIAFQEDIACGLMYVFLPGYGLYYVFTRWSKCGKLFMIGIFCWMAAQIGWAGLAMAPHFAEQAPEGDEQSMLRALNQPMAVARAPLLPSSAECDGTRGVVGRNFAPFLEGG